MRPARMLLGTALALAVAWPACAEPVPSPATVLTEGAEVRGRTSTESAVYVTQRLPRGSVVQVVERMPNGWLKVEPPRGSFSWVNTRYLLTGQSGVWVVEASDQPVNTLVGSWVREDRPNVVGATLARGTQVIAAGGNLLHQEDGDWLRILPPPGEYRYVLEKDVSAPPGASSPPTTIAARPSTPASPAGTGGDLPALPPVAKEASKASSLEVHVGGPPPAGDALLQQAEQLERAGNLTGAAQVYEQLGRNLWATDHDAAVQYNNRAAWLRGRTAPVAPAPSPVTEADALYQRAGQAEKSGDWAGAVRDYTRLGDLFSDSDYKLSLQYYNRANWLKQKHPATSAAQAPPAAPAPQGGVVQSRAITLQELGPGRLDSSPTPIDGQPTYVLQSAQGAPIGYLSPQPGVALERYVGQNVSVLGSSVQRSDLRVPYMKVVRVVPPASP